MSEQKQAMQRQPVRRGPMGRGPMGSGEKAKDFKGTIKRLLAYIGQYKFAVLAVMILAVGSTVFTVIGPKTMGRATTELANGLMAKIQGIGGIDFGAIGSILLLVLGMYAISALFNFVQGYIMTGITQKICYRMRKEISEKIDRMPMK